VPVPSPEDPDDALAAVMRGLSASANRANLARSAVIGEALRAAETGRLEEQQRQEAEAAAHQLAGSAGTFGLPRASRLAADLEDFFAAVAREKPPTTETSALQRAGRELQQLRDLLVSGAGHTDEE
jgi:HPt (histidine-containing phosphotransfer) domain-containing protein